MVLVASQERRERALYPENKDSFHEISLVQYCLLEVVGCARHYGIQRTKITKNYLRIDARSTFHHCKVLVTSGLVRIKVQTYTWHVVCVPAHVPVHACEYGTPLGVEPGALCWLKYILCFLCERFECIHVFVYCRLFIVCLYCVTGQSGEEGSACGDSSPPPPTELPVSLLDARCQLSRDDQQPSPACPSPHPDHQYPL